MKINMLVMDVDGTLTDGKIHIGSNGEVMKAFNVKDGLGIMKLHKNNIIPVIITGRQSEIVDRRAKELKIGEVHQGIEDKSKKLIEILKKYKYEFSQVAYIGDDENDLECMNLCSVKGCPSDAINEIKEIADFVSTLQGGCGAVREFIEYILCKS